jgi:MFS superfamily sulfate permease-like transporter
MAGQRVRFDRHELAGSFGDVGTDLPLIVAMITAAGLDGANVFIVFGALQIASGLVYGLPMPLQPLKAVAVLVITHKIGGPVLFGAGLSIAIIMLVLSASGLLGWLARVIPPVAVRGVQLGLGLSLGSLALKQYVPSLGAPGYVLSALCFGVSLLLWNHRKLPGALVVIGLGLAYAAFTADWAAVATVSPHSLPTFRVPTVEELGTGLVLLALPQLPLSLSNSVIATEQALRDFFPDRAIRVRRIGLTYGAANVIASLFGGIPVCHGCGGLAGHYAFGARTGGSVVIYGGFYIAAGLLFGDAVGTFVEVFPRPVLGVILLFEAVALIGLIRDTMRHSSEFFIVIVVGLIAFCVTQGFIVGLLIGTVMHHVGVRQARIRRADIHHDR